MPEKKYPVLVIIHGESFSWGSGNLYDGRALATYGQMVVITINFRLGVFGKETFIVRFTEIILQSF